MSRRCPERNRPYETEFHARADRRRSSITIFERLAAGFQEAKDKVPSPHLKGYRRAQRFVGSRGGAPLAIGGSTLENGTARGVSDDIGQLECVGTGGIVLVLADRIALIVLSNATYLNAGTAVTIT